MSILLTIKSPAGMIIASDSRLTLRKGNPDGTSERCAIDWAEKVFVPGPPNTSLAVGFYGAAGVGNRGVGDLITEWARGIGTRMSVEALARSLHSFLKAQDLGELCLMMAGYDETNYFGRVFQILNSGVTETHQGTTAITLGGQSSVAVAISQKLEMPLELMPLQGCAELARYLIRAEIDSQAFNLAFAGVGGAAQVCILERGKPARKE